MKDQQKSKLYLLPLISVLIALVVFIYTLISVSYKIGFDEGSSITIEYFDGIIKKQIESDTVVTKLIIVTELDTNAYILSNKSIWDCKNSQKQP